ncbi:MAG: aminoacyl-tRNA hydrolase [Acidobacteria bacterium]|nr:MAG: aminoacyl-tRNA hydrolase [Acidobacteriota bacterium]
MKLIVGLGNPGDKYAGNRHNIGFMAVDELARGYSFGPWKRRFQGSAAEGQIGVVKCILVKPSTYMNESGRAVGEAMRFYKISIGDVIVVHDELDLKPGMVRVKTGGSNAGHNGLKSISAHIGNEYMRVRLGIGHPGEKTLVANYVLQDFAKPDKEWLEPLLEGVARGMVRLVEGSEASFLSEAARGRIPSPAAAKLNGAAAPAKIEARPPKIEAAPSPRQAELAAIAAAASRPIQAMPVVSVPVVASREGGGGGAVSKAVIMPEPERPAPVAAKAPPPPEPQPSPAPQITPEPVHAAAEAVAAFKPEPSPAPIAAAEASPAKVEIARETIISKPQPAPAAPKKGGFFSRWFRARVRGGSH